MGDILSQTRTKQPVAEAADAVRSALWDAEMGEGTVGVLDD